MSYQKGIPMRVWVEELQAKLEKQFGATKGKALAKKYAHAFPTSYQEDFSVDEAINDIKRIEQLTSEKSLAIYMYDRNKVDRSRLYLKLIQFDNPIALSDILPMLENMDLRTFSERSYRLPISNEQKIWISDFSISYTKPIHFDFEKIKPIFQEAFFNISNQVCENDGFNKLILGAELPWREIVILRAYAKYLHQIGIRYSQIYFEKTLAEHPVIAKDLIELFKNKFDPQQKKSQKTLCNRLNKQIKNNLKAVVSLDQDRILRIIWQVILATLRTNYFQKNKEGMDKDYLSIKLSSKDIPDLPLPHPLYEIFVYSPHFEAIHLRSAKVARGGIRWSDRREDFRTEILGLMKAQKVKNAIIVPSGAKGGFVLKSLSSLGSREAIQAEVIRCYKLFMCGLLDLTDNLVNKQVIRPPKVVCYDDDDPYLVVAADKGTAAFSDIANSISQEYRFWLGDAFASGGSTGYDHKKMGITARGAWESVKRHFRTLNKDIQTTSFTVVGIGDMSGDVFGNGLLRSEHIKLVAAFDHRHIFIDPNPHPQKSFAERARLFNLPTSSWEDYDSTLLSKGGGVFNRMSKSILLSPEIKRLLAIKDSTLTPNELIRAILKAPVDLLYNGGIGTYVKASSESHAEVGDKANEFCRVNGNELRCQVVGEGGNLGFTQLGRIEYALQGGLINTDFIDNSGGVDCSDHEVNIKILLDQEIRDRKLSEKKRNPLLSSLSEAVGNLVLRDNYNQALTMSVVTNHASKLINLYHAYLKDLESAGVVDRTVEFLPDDKTLLERKAAGKGLMSPELAILLAYSKIHVKSEIIKSDVPEDPYLRDVVAYAFPRTLSKHFGKAMQKHPLRREIIATQLSSFIVNDMGLTFVYRLQIETGATVGEIIRAYVAAEKIYDIHELLKSIDSLGFKFPTNEQYVFMHYVRGLANLATRWFLQGNRLKGGSLEKIINHYSTQIKKLEHIVPELMVGITKNYMETTIARFAKADLPEELGRRIAITRAMFTALNIIEVSTQNKFDLLKTAKLYFNVGARFNLVWFRDLIASDAREGHWNSLARITLRDELDILQKLLTIVIMKSDKKEKNADVLIDNWMANNQRAVDRWEKVLELLFAATPPEYAMFFIAIRELSNWVAASKTKNHF